jgi:chromosome segregation ATPase
LAIFKRIGTFPVRSFTERVSGRACNKTNHGYNCILINNEDYLLNYIYVGVTEMTEENEIVRLEGFVSSLLEKFNALQAKNADLTERLGKRETTIETLQDDLASMKNERGEISTRVSSLIGKIEDWEASTSVTDDEADKKDLLDSESEDKSSDSGVQGNLFTVDAQTEQQ